MSDVTHAQAEVTKPVKATRAPAKKAAEKAATKPATKAPAKAKAAKPATKKPAKAAKAVVAPAPQGVAYTITNRPSSGVLLFAYTESALRLLGMYDGEAQEKAKLSKVMGATAISYHVNKGTMVRRDDGKYELTSAGVAFFEERATRAQEKHVEMFTTMMTTGDIVGDTYKNNDQVIKIA